MLGVAPAKHIKVISTLKCFRMQRFKDHWPRLIVPPLNEVERGILASPYPSLCLGTEPCPLCIFYNTRRIHFIYTHLVKQEGVFSKFRKLRFWQILEFFNCDIVLFWFGVQYELVNSLDNSQPIVFSDHIHKYSYKCINWVERLWPIIWS